MGPSISVPQFYVIPKILRNTSPTILRKACTRLSGLLKSIQISWKPYQVFGTFKAATLRQEPLYFQS